MAAPRRPGTPGPAPVLALRLAQVRSLIQQRQLPAARQLLGDITRDDPDSGEAQFLQGALASLEGNPAAALEHVQRAVHLERGNATYHFQAGILLDAAGRHAEAAARYRDTLRLNPQLVEAHYNLGLTLERLGDPDGAMRCYRHALAQRPQFVEALNNLGNLLLAAGQAAEALGVLNQAIALRPAFHIPYNNLGNALLRLDRRSEAIAAFRAALAIDADFAAARSSLAEQLQRDGQTAAAIAEYQRLLATQPDHAEARFALAALREENPPAPPDSFVRKVFDELAPQFDSHLVQTLGYAIPGLLIETLRPWLEARPPVTVLDLGCGTGLFGQEVKPWSRDLIGIDLSPEMVARAQQRGLYDQVQAAELGAFLASRGDASADLVSATDVFVYAGDLERIFAQASRVLAPEGRFAFSVERTDTGDYVLRQTHRYAHSGHYVRRLAAAHGLTVDSAIDTPIRKERGEPIPGYLFVLVKR